MNHPTILLLLLSLLISANARPLNTGALPRSTTSPKITCATSHSSPLTSILLRAGTVFTSICNPLSPPTVPTTKACIVLNQDAGMGFSINLCGWETIMEDCTDAIRAVQAVVDKCAVDGRAAGDAEWEWGVISITGVVGRSSRTREQIDSRR